MKIRTIALLHKRPAWLLWVFLTLIALLPMIATACTPTRTSIDPPFHYLDARYATAEALATEAARLCPGNDPAHAFTTDGCSMWPDGAWRECCVAHDVEYWCGGANMDRGAADRVLRQCVREVSNPAHAFMMYLGVRAGGHRWWPFGWRWGYGHSWPYGGQAQPAAAPSAENAPLPGIDVGATVTQKTH